MTDLDTTPGLTITPAAGGAPVHGPSDFAIAHPYTGIYTYTWTLPAGVGPGVYTVLWQGLADGDVVTTSEVLDVTAVPAPPTGTGVVPCPGSWEPLWCGPLPDPADYPDVDLAAVIAAQSTAAAEILYALTAQRFGLCQVTLRPCRRDCWGGAGPGGGQWWEWTAGGMWPRPALIDGAWFNLGCGGCPGSCSCQPLSEALLPEVAHSIDEVLLDGVPLAAGVDWRLDNGRRLVRLGGSWPVCQRMDLPDTDPGTWSVTATYGEPLPVSGQLALGELAGELINACIGADCRLPQPVQQLVRQGITISYLDPGELFAAGRIGLTKVDLFIQWANPDQLRSAPRVFDIDAPTWRRTG